MQKLFNPGVGITEEQFRIVAKKLNCDVACIKAIREVEAPRGPFDELGRLTILFEPYTFYKELRKRGIDVKKYLNNPKYKSIIVDSYSLVKYGKYSEQYSKLELAKSINEEAALMSCSYGSFQVMGFNFKECGFKTVRELIAYLQESEFNHLEAFEDYIKNVFLDDELRNKDWLNFALQYNGPSYWKNKYDSKLAAAFKKFSK